MVLKKYGFSEDFIDWIKILLRYQESCVINGGHTTTYFRLERGARQGDPILAYLFILALELFFILIKSNKNIHGINIFNHDFLYTAYADGTTFFLKDLDSVKNVLEVLNQFYMVSGLRPNINKCEIAGIGSLKDAKVALCGLKSLDLTKESIKILGVHISYNKKLQDDINFCMTVKHICNVIKLWRIRHLPLEGKTTIFKSLALSKIVYLALLTIVPKSIIEELNEIQKKFLWPNKKCKVKHGTLCNDYKNGGLRNVDIHLKIVSLKCPWIRRLHNECHHDWKIIPLDYMNNALGKNFKFHSNLSVPNKTINSLPSYCKDIINSWCKYYSCTPKVSSLISSQFLWYNSYIKIDNEVVCYKDFADKKINFVSDLFDENGELKSWQKILSDFQ